MGYVRHCEAVTGETGTLGTNVPTVSGDAWRARTVVGLGMGPLEKPSSKVANLCLGHVTTSILASRTTLSGCNAM